MDNEEFNEVKNFAHQLEGQFPKEKSQKLVGFLKVDKDEESQKNVSDRLRSIQLAQKRQSTTEWNEGVMTGKQVLSKRNM